MSQKIRVLCGQDASRDIIMRAACDSWGSHVPKAAAAAVHPNSGGKVAAAARWSQQGSAKESVVRSERIRERGGDLARKRRCFGCGKVRHFRRDCKEECSRCGNIGHVATVCDQPSGNADGEL